MNELIETQIAHLLKIAQEQLAYSKFILDYPNSAGRKNFDTVSQVDVFYKNMCNVFFYDSLLVTASLLGKDSRLVSFWKWSDFVSEKQTQLTEINNSFKSSGLKEIRDQIVGHIDSSNPANQFPYYERKGHIGEEFIKRLAEIQLKLINEFYDYTKKHSSSYSGDYFDITENIQTIKDLMDKFKPTLTDNDVI